ncbi:hypothetical protein SMICM17S_10274 [Streptomyces microflavus]
MPPTTASAIPTPPEPCPAVAACAAFAWRSQLVRPGGRLGALPAVLALPVSTDFGHQLTDRAAARGEAPVQEVGGLLVDGVALLRRRVHDGDQQHPAVALGDAGEGVACMGGVAA